MELAPRPFEQCSVNARSSFEEVIAVTAHQLIGDAIADQQVIAGAAQNSVCTCTT